MLTPRQAGFRKGRSIHDNIALLYTHVMQSFAERGGSSAVFLDLEAAYDRVSPSILFARLLQIGLPKRVCCALYGLSESREIRVRVGEEMWGPRNNYLGLPQGSVLSPILFNVYVNDVLDNLPGGVKALIYADDFVLYTTINNIQAREESLSVALTAVARSLSALGLSLSIEKCGSLNFNRTSLSRINVEMDGTVVPSVDRYKFLGVTFDHRLDFRAHTDNVVKACGKSLNIIKALSARSWGSDPRILVHIYKAMVRSLIDSCAMISTNLTKRDFARLRGVQSQALRIAMGYFRSSPISAMEVETGVPPLVEHFKLSTTRFLLAHGRRRDLSLFRDLFRLGELWRSHPVAYLPALPGLVGAAYVLEERGAIVGEGLPCYSTPYRVYTQSVNTDLSLTSADFSDIHQFNQSVFNEKVRLKYPEHVFIYTDGSKVRGRLSFGMVCEGQGWSETGQLPSDQGIMTAEMFAISRALIQVTERQLSRVVVASDSLSSLQCLGRGGVLASSSSLELWVRRQLAAAREEGRSVVLVWVPGHRGIVGNEKADKLANNPDNVFFNLAPSSDFCRTLLKLELSTSWEKSWRRGSTGRFLRRFREGVSLRPWCHGLDIFNRRDLISLGRLRIGHGRFPAHLHRLRMTASDLCGCGQRADLTHVFLECPDNGRCYGLYQNLARIVGAPLDLFTALGEADERVYRVLLDFIKSSDIQM